MPNDPMLATNAVAVLLVLAFIVDRALGEVIFTQAIRIKTAGASDHQRRKAKAKAKTSKAVKAHSLKAKPN